LATVVGQRPPLRIVVEQLVVTDILDVLIGGGSRL